MTGTPYENALVCSHANISGDFASNCKKFSGDKKKKILRLLRDVASLYVSMDSSQSALSSRANRSALQIRNLKFFAMNTAPLFAVLN